MLICSTQSLAFVAVPKTGTTAIEMALKPRADIVFTKQRKHMTARRYHQKVAPFLADTFDLSPEVFAAMRDPEEQIRSWFRYRTAERLLGSGNSTGGMTFDDFVLDVISDDPPPHARIGSQYRMLTSRTGEVLVHHLFAYESPPLLRAFLNDRFGEAIALKQKNVSPFVKAPLSASVRDRLRAARGTEFDLYARLRDAGGHLRTRLS